MVLESERLTFNHVLVAHTIGGAIVGVLLAPGRVELLGAAAARRAGRSRRRRAAPTHAYATHPSARAQVLTPHRAFGRLSGAPRDDRAEPERARLGPTGRTDWVRQGL